MKTIIKFFCIAVIGLSFAQCANNSDKSTESGTQGDTAIIDTNTVKILPVYLFDSIEHFFGNENWLTIKANDTSYLLFSRQDPTHVKISQYKMSNGDSTGGISSWIAFSHDSVVWQKADQPLLLLPVKGEEMIWKKMGTGDSSTISFTKKAPDHINFTDGFETGTMKRTLTLSLFLIRSHYDYAHGTHYAFDTTDYNRIKQQQKHNGQMIRVKP